MTRKYMKKFANEKYNCELIHQNENASKEDKAHAEDRIIQLTKQIMAFPDGINALLEIDALVVSKIK